MRRIGLVGCGILLVAGASSRAHYLYLTPPGDGRSTQVVWGDLPVPDPTVGFDVANEGHYTAVDGQGRTVPLSPKAEAEGVLKLPELAPGTVEVVGTLDYGVIVRGQPEPALVRHHAKVVVVPFGPGTKLPDQRSPLPAELTPVARPGGIAFALTVGGKKVPSADVLVVVPDEKRPRPVRTDAAGVTPSFDRGGSYTVRAYQTEEVAGEFRGRKYKQIRHYTTLTVRFDPIR